MPVKIIHHLLNVVGGSQEQNAKKEGDREVMQVCRKEMCERKTKHLRILDGSRGGLHQAGLCAFHLSFTPYMSISVWSLGFYHARKHKFTPQKIVPFFLSLQIVHP